MMNINELLQCIADGKESEANTMLQDNSALIEAKGTVTDHAGRTFKDITPLQMAAWNLDWHMLSMLETYFPREVDGSVKIEFAEAQLPGLLIGPWKKKYRVNAGRYLRDVIELLRRGFDSDMDCSIPNSPGERFWITEIGGAQNKFPMNFFQEYCVFRRKFQQDINSLHFDEGELSRSTLYNASNSLDSSTNPQNELNINDIGKKFGLFRGGHETLYPCPLGTYRAPKMKHPVIISEISALEKLLKTRLEQYTNFRNHLAKRCQTLNFSNNAVFNIDEVVEVIKDNTNLKTLILSKNDIGRLDDRKFGEILTKLSNAWCSCCKLERLDLSSNYLGELSSDKLIFLAQLIVKHPNFNDLSIKATVGLRGKLDEDQFKELLSVLGSNNPTQSQLSGLNFTLEDLNPTQYNALFFVVKGESARFTFLYDVKCKEISYKAEEKKQEIKEKKQETTGMTIEQFRKFDHTQRMNLMSSLPKENVRKIFLEMTPAERTNHLTI